MSPTTSQLQQRFRLDDRIALVTGAAGHLGVAITDGLMDLGASIAATDRDAEGLASLQARRPPERLTTHAAELERDEEVRGIAAWLERTRGDRLDVLVCSAAFVGDSALTGWAVGFEGQSVETWRRALEVNLTSVFALVKACLPMLRRSDAPSVVLVGSIYGVVGPDWGLYEGTRMGNPAAYAASKGGLVQLTRWLATSLAPHVRVNAVSPGGIFRGHEEPFLSRYVRRTPLQRMGKEADVVGAVAFLASDLSSYVTGQNLMVDGGWTAW